MKHFILFISICLLALQVNAQQTGFTENKGQVIDQNGLVRNDIRFISCHQNFKLYLKENSFSYELYKPELENNSLPSRFSDSQVKKLTVQSHRVDIDLVGANANPEIFSEGKSSAYYNYYTAGTADGINNVRNYDKITYKNIYHNIDMVFYASANQIKYDFIVNPGGNVSDIQLQYNGADGITLEDGNVKVKTSQGNVDENIPMVYEKRLGENEIVKASYTLENDIVRFCVGEYNRENILVIDPQLIWGTYFGGGNVEEARDVVTDVNGNPVVVGLTASTSNIATSGAYQTTYGGGSYDAFIFKLNSDGATMLWATYFGGSDFDQANGIVMDSNGDYFIAGETLSSSGISTTGTYQPVFTSPYSNAFISKFSSAGIRLWGTYYGEGITYAQDIALDNNGDLLIAGGTEAEVNIASSGAHQTVYGGSVRDGWVLKLTNDGVTRIWATYYGDNGFDEINDIYTDASNNVVVTGETQGGANIPSTGAHQTTYGGGIFDAFIVKFDVDGNRLWGTYYGGDGDDDWGQGVTADGDGNVYVTGKTSSTDNISTNNIYQPVPGSMAPSTDAFIVKFNLNGVRQWGTYFGGSGFGNGEGGYAIKLDAAKNIFIAGQTNSSDAIACLLAHDTAYSFNEDAFAAKFDNNGVCRIWGTYFGGLGAGSPDDRAQGIAIDNNNNIVIVGFTQSSSEIASSDAYQTVFGGGFGGGDAFVAKLEDISCANCVAMSVTISVTDNQCSSECTGTATADINGGTAPYTFNWSDGQTTQTAIQLCDGNYLLTITDASGLTTTATAIISSPAPINIGNIIGEDSVIINSTSAYSITSIAGAMYNWTTTNGSITSGQGSNSIDILWDATGIANVIVIVTDSNGCVSSDTLIVRIYDPNIIATFSDDFEINLYPVPANENISLEIVSANSIQAVLKIFSVNGSLISNKLIAIRKGENVYQVDLESYASGAYLLQLITDDEVRYLRFVKE